MKRTVLLLLLACALCTEVFAQQSLYVSARGSNENDGLSETTPFKTLGFAVLWAYLFDINKITVIGTLDAVSEAPPETIIQQKTRMFQ